VVIDRAMRRARAHSLWEGTGVCLIVAQALQEVLEAMDYRAWIQAGTMSWPIVRREDDDGISPTHFGYQWSPTEIPSQIATMLNCMPEMHVWVAIPGAIEVLVDPTTQFLQEQCQKLTGLPWRHDPPPEYLWVPHDDLPSGVVYEAVPDATRLAQKMITEMQDLD
jgi:hypothetical protein